MRATIPEEAAPRPVVGQGGGPDDTGHAGRDRPGAHGLSTGPGRGQVRVDGVDDDGGAVEFGGHNASIEYDDPAHPARAQARGYREALRARLTGLATRLDADGGPALGGQLAVLVGGAYTSAAHLGPDGPAADGLRLARQLIRERQ